MYFTVIYVHLLLVVFDMQIRFDMIDLSFVLFYPCYRSSRVTVIKRQCRINVEMTLKFDIRRLGVNFGKCLIVFYTDGLYKRNTWIAALIYVSKKYAKQSI